jgi:hypothetical protein
VVASCHLAGDAASLRTGEIEAVKNHSFAGFQRLGDFLVPSFDLRVEVGVRPIDRTGNVVDPVKVGNADVVDQDILRLLKCKEFCKPDARGLTLGDVG